MKNMKKVLVVLALMTGLSLNAQLNSKDSTILADYAKTQGWDKVTNKKAFSTIEATRDKFNKTINYHSMFTNYGRLVLSFTGYANNGSMLTMSLSYYDENWLFCEGAKILIKNDVYTLKTGKWYRKVYTGTSIGETAYIHNEDIGMELLIALCEVKNVKVRYIGSDSMSTKTVAVGTKKFRNVLRAYYVGYVRGTNVF